MTIKKGYIKINRAILHHPSLQRKDRSFCEIGAFIWLLLEALNLTNSSTLIVSLNHQFKTCILTF